MKKKRKKKKQEHWMTVLSLAMVTAKICVTLKNAVCVCAYVFNHYLECHVQNDKSKSK